jgi:YVTN family beta-propeller protein
MQDYIFRQLFSPPDGSTALLTRDGDNMISVLAIAGSKVELTGRDMSAGLRPDSIDITPTGRVAVVANIGPGTGDADTVSVIDVAANPARVVETVTVGQTPEGVALSADGAFLAVTVMNGSNKTKTSAFYNDFGLVKVFRLSGTVLTPITEARVGHWCQGAAWSTDHKTLLVQCMTEHEIFIFGFDGSRLTKHPPITLSGGPAGIRTAKR